MKHAKKALAAMAVALLVTISLGPALMPAEEAEADPWLDPGTEEAIDWWLRVIPGVNTAKGIYDFITRDQGREEVPAGSDEAVKAYARDVDALRSAEQMYNLYGISASFVRADTETWKLTNSYLNRAAEIGAGSLWYEGSQFDADSILEYAGVYDSIGNGNRNIQEILDEAVRVSADLKSVWNSTNYGSSLEIELKWDSAGTGNSTTRLTLDFMTLATATADRNVIYLTKSDTTAAPDTAKTIWAYTTSGSITPIAPGSAPMALSLGANDVSSLQSGFYVLSPGVYGGPFVSGTNTNAAIVKGAVGIIKDTDYGYITALSDTGVTVHWSGNTYSSSNLNFSITGSSTAQTSLNAPLQLVLAYSAFMDQISSLLYEAASSAQVMWTISANAQKSNILLSPFSIIPALSNVGVSPEQSYALYVLALDQLGQYNANYGETLRDGMTKISAQSLDLYCHGSIYSGDGTLIAEDLIFTPYVYVKDWTIYSGTNNTLTQDGMVMIWDTGTTAVGWEGPSSSTSYSSVIMEKGQYFHIDEIHYKGELAPSLKMEVVSIEQIEVFQGVSWHRPDSPAVLSAADLISIILVEAAIILVLLGYITGIRYFYLAAAIIVLLGLFAGEAVAKLILGLI
jgi:hypothetical protein